MSAPKKPFQIALIGCGRIAGHHARNIQATPGAELAAVCDLQIEKANAYSKEFNVPAYSDYRKMLAENPGIDTVAVITPSGMHFEHAMEIIETYKKNVIVEKPTFLRPSEIEKAYAAAQKAGVSIFPVFQNRYNLAVQRVKQGILNGELGAIRTFSIRVRWCRPQSYYDLAPWRGTFAMDGGAMTNQGIHHIDLMRFLGGIEIDSVCATMATLGAQIEVEDAATATFKFKTGAIGNLEITTSARPKDYEASISLVCEKGLAQIGGIAVNELQVYTPDPDACAKASEDFSDCVYGNGHGAMYRDIVAALLGERAYPVSQADCSGTIQLLNAFYLSDEQKKWVAPAAGSDSSRLGRADEALAKIYRTPRN